MQHCSVVMSIMQNEKPAIPLLIERYRSQGCITWTMLNIADVRRPLPLSCPSIDRLKVQACTINVPIGFA